MKKIFSLIVIIALIASCKTEKKAETPSQLKTYFENNSIPAAVMGSVSNDGEMTWKAFGPSIWGTTDTVTQDHIFRIFSMTKAIASVAALQLVEQGKLSLDDPLNELMPEMVSIPILTEGGDLINSDKAITLRHLLTHTAGFGYNFTSARLSNFKPDVWEYDDLPRLFEPGARFNYGTNTDWVGKIVEKVSGQTLEAYFREHITGPLKMDRTWFNVPDNLKPTIVSWGARDSTSFMEYGRIPQEPETTYSAGGGLYASPKDYITFLKCILNDGKHENGSILKPETVAMMFKNSLPGTLNLNFDIPEEGLPTTMGRFADESDKYGLAWAIENSEDELVRAKGAAYWAGIANSYYTVDKESGIAVVYFTQFFPFNDKVSYDFYRLFEKEEYSKIDNE